MDNINRRINGIDAGTKGPSRLERKVTNILRERKRPEVKSNLTTGSFAGTRNNFDQEFSDKNIGQKRYYHPGYLGSLENDEVRGVLGGRREHKDSLDETTDSEIDNSNDEEIVKIDLV